MHFTSPKRIRLLIDILLIGGSTGTFDNVFCKYKDDNEGEDKEEGEGDDD